MAQATNKISLPPLPHSIYEERAPTADSEMQYCGINRVGRFLDLCCSHASAHLPTLLVMFLPAAGTNAMTLSGTGRL